METHKIIKLSAVRKHSPENNVVVVVQKHSHYVYSVM